MRKSLLFLFAGILLAVLPSLAIGQINSSVTSGCAPLSVTFSASGLGSNLTWTFSNGMTSTAVQPQMIFMAPGTYSVTVTNGSNALSSTNLVTVHALPNPSFTVNTDSVCPGDTINFSPSVGAGSSLYWDFDDGSASTQGAVSHAFTAGGSYDVTLMETNTNGCSGYFTRPEPIQVTQTPSLSIVSNQELFCSSPAAWSATVSDTTLGGYQWYVDQTLIDSGAAVSYTFTNPGTHQVRVESSTGEGCASVAIANIEVVSPFQPDYSVLDLEGCTPHLLAVDDVAGLDGELWTSNQPADERINEGFLLSGAGQHEVYLSATDANGCAIVDTLSVSVLEAPVAAFQLSDTLVCAPGLVELASADTSATNHWTVNLDTYVGDSLQLNLNEVGDYDVALISSYANGCADTTVALDAFAVESGRPEIDFTAQQSCAEIDAQLEHANPSLQSALWLVPNVDTALGNIANLLIDEVGSHEMVFIGESHQGCVDTTHYPNMFRYELLDIGYESPSEITLCEDGQVTFDGTIIGHDDYEWYLNGSLVSTDSVYVGQFEVAGTYVIGFKATSLNACPIDLDTHTIVRLGKPQATISVDSVSCSTQELFLSTTGTAIAQRSWNVNGMPFSTEQIVYTLGSSLTASISLNITDSLGCTASTQMVSNAMILACDTQTALAYSGGSGWGMDEQQPLQACAPTSFSFQAPLDTSWQSIWNFGDGHIDTGLQVSHVYDTAGVFTITVINSQQSTGLIDTAEFASAVQIGKPVARFEPVVTNLCEGHVVRLENQSEFASTYLTTFSDSIASTAFEASHLYDSAGYYTVQLQAFDSLGCSAQTSQLVKAGHPFTETQVPSVLCTTGTVTVLHNLTGYESYQWQIGTQNFVQKFPVVQIAAPGNYPISLTVTDTAGCQQQLLDDDTLRVLNPSASFSLPVTYTGCDTARGTLVNTSIDASFYTWYLNGNLVSNAPNWDMLIAEEGQHTVTLKSRKGICVSEFTDTVQVHHAVADFSFTPSSYCLPATLSFADSSQHAVSWEWSIGDSTYTASSPSVQLSEIHQEEFELSIVDSFGCEAHARQPVPGFVQPSFSLNQSAYCPPFDVTIVGESAGSSTWMWNIGGAMYTGDSVAFLVQNDVPNVDVTVTHSSGCQVQRSLDSLVEMEVPQAEFSIASVVDSCAPVIVEFENLASNASHYRWIFDDGTQSTEESPSHMYRTKGTYDVQLIAVSTTGCTDTFAMDNAVQVYGPEAQFSTNASTLCMGQPITLTNTSTDMQTAWWNFGDGNTSADVNPQYTYEHADTFDIALVVTDSLGCMDFDYKTGLVVHETPAIDMDLIPLSSCLPAQVAVIDRSQGLVDPTYAWSSDLGTSIAHGDTLVITEPGDHLLSLSLRNASGCLADTAFDERISVYDTSMVSSSELRSINVRGDETTVEYVVKRGHGFIASHLYAEHDGSWSEVVTESDALIAYTDAIQAPTERPACFKLTLEQQCAADQVAEVKTDCSIHLTAEDVPEGRHVKWSAFESAPFKQYELFVHPTKTPEHRVLLGTLENGTNSFIDSVDRCPGEVYYSVQAKSLNNGAGNAMSNSDKLLVDTLDYLVEPKDVELVTVNDDGSILVQWKPESDKSLVMGYRLIRSTEEDELVIGSFGVQEGLYVDYEVDVQSQSYGYVLERENVCALKGIIGAGGNSILLELEQEGQEVRLNWNNYKEWEGDVRKFELQRRNEYGEWETYQLLSPEEYKSMINLLEVD